MTLQKQNKAFTLIELIIVIVILGIISVAAAPRFIDVARDARIASLETIASQMKTITRLAEAKARVSGIRPSGTNPVTNGIQTEYIVDFGFGSSEVDFRNLCPESIAEAADQLQMLDFIGNDINQDMQIRVTNQHTLVGYIVPDSGVPTNQGCYVIYDSFGNPFCTVTVVTEDC